MFGAVTNYNICYCIISKLKQLSIKTNAATRGLLSCWINGYWLLSFHAFAPSGIATATLAPSFVFLANSLLVNTKSSTYLFHSFHVRFFIAMQSIAHILNCIGSKAMTVFTLR